MSGVGDLWDLLRNTGDIVEKAKSAQAGLAKLNAEGQAGAGLVTARVNGLGDLVGIEFDRSVVNPDDVELLSDLVIGAVADARRKSAELRSQAIAELTGGMDLSAFGLDMGNLM
ncbi:MAG: YbaB/EbfC family nucleoid-associated protein [Planctomycetota bacterium]|jgi:DNA-binding YbaB/EbfC family protein|nr:YbaB/EbfC family nucleoid-associated protein [Planctomycetota bacterium]